MNQVISKATIGVTLVGVAIATSAPVQATCVPEPYIGSICATAANFCPRGYALTDGRLLSIAQHTSLFSLLGTNFGGDGRINFGLPDLRGRSMIGYGNSPGMQYGVPLAGKRGNEISTLAVGNMPSHDHAMTGAKTAATVVETAIPAQSKDGNQPDPAPTNVLAGAGRTGQKIYSDEGVDTSLQGPAVQIPVLEVTGNVAPTGGNQAFSNMPPQLAVTYCIAVDGLYPPRD